MNEARVLEVFGEPIYYGGQEMFVINFLEHMDKTGLHIDLLTPYQSSNNEIKNKIESWGGKIYELGLEHKPGQSRFDMGKALGAFFKENKYDVVHIHSGSISALAIASYVAKKNGINKVIVHSHSAGMNKDNLKHKLLRAYGYMKMRNAVDVYCACSKVAGEAKFVKSVVNNKLVIINNGVDLNKYSYNPKTRKSIRDELNIDDNTFVLGHVGRFSPPKNHTYLIDIFNDYLKINKNSKLVMIGEGNLLQEAKEHVNKLNIDDKVIFIKNVNNVQDYLQAFDIFVLPSRWEGLPLVGVEAQANGLPILASTNVSKELEITDNVKFLPIDQGTKIWVDEIDKYKNFPRSDTKEIIKSKGYDIYDVSRKIKELYI